MAESIYTKNPYTGKTLQEYTLNTDTELQHMLQKSAHAFTQWKNEAIENRVLLLEKLSTHLEKHLERYAQLITNEMGKPITESRAEIDKCIWMIDFYERNAESLLSDELIDTEATESFISYDPLGCILGVMPWNYPFWQALRFAVPTLTAGNTVVLKHASNVTGCALILQHIFEEMHYPEGCFQTLLVTHRQIEDVIASSQVQGVSVTGSEKAGRTIAAIAGKNLKKTVLELGGNNACIVWDDADLNAHMKTMVNARMQNAGQSCIAAKRFIIEKDIYDTFLDQFIAQVKKLKLGDPLEANTQIGTLAHTDFADTIAQQVADSVAKGAKVVYGNTHSGAIYHPTVVTEVTPGMPLFDDEVFGPVAAIIKAEDKEHAFALAAQSRFGLGTMLFTESIEEALQQIYHIEDGSFFINELVKSDPRLPFGGTKASGYGRELSREGMLAFTNKKTVYLR